MASGQPTSICHQQPAAACSTLQVPLSQEELEGQAKVDKLALGVAGGFNPDAAKHRVEEKYFLAVVPQQLRIPLPCPDLPELVLNAVEAVQVCTFHVCKFCNGLQASSAACSFCTAAGSFEAASVCLRVYLDKVKSSEQLPVLEAV